MKNNTQSSSLTVFLIEDDQALTQLFASALAHSRYHLCYTVPSGSNLLKEIETCKPDIIIVNLTNNHQVMQESFRMVMRYLPTPIVVFSSQRDPQFINQMIACGISAYITGEIELMQVPVILDTAMASFNELQQLKHQLTETRKKLSDQRVISRAKCWLIEHQKMSEPVAYRYLQKLAMDKGQKLERVAEHIVSLAAMSSSE